MIEKNILINNKGVALVIALLMLLVLTIIGIASVSTTIFEANIAGNERVGVDAFYTSEAGSQVGVSKLPDSTPIAKTKLQDDSYYWGGGPADEGSPRGAKSLGMFMAPGYEATSPGWGFTRYQVNATGKSFGGLKEIEVQASYGPFSPMTTQYN